MYVFLPKNGRPPYQTLVFAPGASAVQPIPAVNYLASPATLGYFDYLMTTGRAVVYPVLAGMHERNTWQTSVYPDPARMGAYREWMIQVARELRRTVDYLETREDIDRAKLIYLGLSWGAMLGPRVLALDGRFAVGVLLDGGASQATTVQELRGVDSFVFARRVKQPVLMVNGSADFTYPAETSQKPLFTQLATAPEHKRHVILPGGHVIINQQRSQVVREVLNWLDKYAGPVAR